MWMFWVLAAGLAAAAAALVAARAASAARQARRRAVGPVEDPRLAVYRRQLAELDTLASRELIGAGEHQAAQAEAARRLLSAAEQRRPGETAQGRGAQLIVALGAVGAAAAALCLYLVLGSPGLPDEPYQARVRAWRAADPTTLDAARVAAVLREIVRERPHDPQALGFLGRAELADGDSFAAAQALRRAVALAPRRADLRIELGEALFADGEGDVTPAAQAAFRQALALDPGDAPARYFLARGEITSGRVQAGLAGWRALADALPLADPRRLSLLQEIQQVALRGAGALDPTGPAMGSPMAESATPSGTPGAAPPGGTPFAAASPEQSAFIRAMVARQAAEVAARPNDPEGWMRLVRAYGVLGDRAAQAQALTTVRRVFRTRPDVLSKIEAEAASNAPPAPPAPSG